MIPSQSNEPPFRPTLFTSSMHELLTFTFSQSDTFIKLAPFIAISFSSLFLSVNEGDDSTTKSENDTDDERDKPSFTITPSITTDVPSTFISPNTIPLSFLLIVLISQFRIVNPISSFLTRFMESEDINVDDFH